MSQDILLVDDDNLCLEGYRRTLRKEFDIAIANHAQEALDLHEKQGPFGVVVADMHMPGMNGVELLKRFKEISPKTVRMMLTGYANQETALQAVNSGEIFRFMVKPCPADQMRAFLLAGLEQYRLLVAERDLLTKTLHGSLKVMTDILSITSPESFGRAIRLRFLTHRLCELVGEKQLWLIDIASMLSQLGCVTVPRETLHRVHAEEEVHPSEMKMYHRHPEVAVKLISSIPRLDGIARIIAYQEKHFDGSGAPTDSIAGKDIPLGSRALKLASDWDCLAMRKIPQEEVESILRQRNGWYDPDLLEVIPELIDREDRYVLREMPIQHLTDMMVMADDIHSFQEMLLCCRGQEITPTLRMRLLNHVDKIGPINSVNVLVPELRVLNASAEEPRFDRFGREIRHTGQAVGS